MGTCNHKDPSQQLRVHDLKVKVVQAHEDDLCLHGAESGTGSDDSVEAFLSFVLVGGHHRSEQS